MFPSIVALLIALGLDALRSRDLADYPGAAGGDPLLRELIPLGFSTWQQAAWTLRVASYEDVDELRAALLATGVSPRPLVRPGVDWMKRGIPEPLRSRLEARQRRLVDIEAEIEEALDQGLDEVADDLEAEHATLNDELLHAAEALEIYDRGVEEAEGFVPNPIDRLMQTMVDPVPYGSPQEHADILRYHLGLLSRDLAPPGKPPPIPLGPPPTERVFFRRDEAGNEVWEDRVRGSCFLWRGAPAVAALTDEEALAWAQEIVGGQLQRRAEIKRRYLEHKEAGRDVEIEAIWDLSRLRASQLSYGTISELRRRMETESYGAWWGRRQVTPMISSVYFSQSAMPGTT